MTSNAAIADRPGNLHQRCSPIMPFVRIGYDFRKRAMETAAVLVGGQRVFALGTASTPVMPLAQIALVLKQPSADEIQ
ncbi:hypothetical protein [uncultured Roseobacter sp.]|uniref:hypothetical protein n=1 Tax=uncultured Roseobacter sp. TaxID=114847 RepID=UPI0026375B75|nr:hypothetical protein [uncultured Roseobacter sp.]